MDAGPSKRRSTRVPRPNKRLKSEAQDDENLKQAEATTRKPQRKGNAGKLAGLICLPLDVLFEIFGSLRPFDLLRLARTTKEFRRLLMHKSAISVWRTVLAQVPGLPECPPGMNEPQWVNLAFDPHCHFCFTPGVRNIEWRFRLRVCAKCAKDHLSESVFYGNMPYDSDEPGSMLMNLIPSRPTKRGRRIYMKRDHHAVEREYNGYKGKEARTAYIAERRQIVKEIHDHAILCEKWTETQSKDRSVELQHLRDERRLAITKNLRALGYEKDIESIKYPDSLDEHKLVKVPQRLTERIWGNIKGPLVEFMEEMRKKRLAREFKELIIQRKQSAVKVLRTFKNEQLPYTEIMPEGPDFCEFEPVKGILEQPAEIDVDETSFAVILPSLPHLIEAWRKNINLQLVRAMRRPNGFRKPGFSVMHAMLLYMGMGYSDHDGIDLDGDATPEHRNESQTDDQLSAKLKLATTVFKCLTCASGDPFFQDDLYSMSSDDGSVSYSQSNPLFYPAVLGHRCLTWTSDMFRPYDSAPDLTHRLEYYTASRKKWNACPLRLDVNMERIVEAVLKIAGMNSATTTPEDMDNLGAWFACLRCATPRNVNKGSTEAYGWRDAVAHVADRHGHPIEELRLMTADEVDEARTRAADRSDPDEPPQQMHWLCTHCRDLSSEREPDKLDKVKFHLQNRHDIDTPEINKDYYKKFSAAPVFPAPRTVVIDVDFGNIDHDSDPFLDEPDMDTYMSDNVEFDEYDGEFY